jgi:hypothetical protein
MRNGQPYQLVVDAPPEDGVWPAPGGTEHHPSGHPQVLHLHAASGHRQRWRLTPGGSMQLWAKAVVANLPADSFQGKGGQGGDDVVMLAGHATHVPNIKLAG